jgi:hypothetical protein
MTKEQIDIVTWILTAISFVGAIYNIGKKTLGFWIWGFADILFTIMYYRIGQPANAVLFAMYTLVNVWGIYQWGKK